MTKNYIGIVLLFNLCIILMFCILTGCDVIQKFNHTSNLSEAESYNCSYWSNKIKNKNKVLMDSNQVKIFSDKVTFEDNINNTNLFNKILSNKQLNKILSRYVKESLPDEIRYIGDVELDDVYYDQILDNVNFEGISDKNIVRCGFIVNNTHIRTFPTDDVSYDEPNDVAIDLNCETGLKIWDRVLVLHISKDKQYYFIKTDFYDGWVSVNDVALTDNITWKKYSDPEDFLIITGDMIELNYNLYNSLTSQIKLSMGTKLPLMNENKKTVSVDHVATVSSYVVDIPIKNDAGMLEIFRARVPFGKDVSNGYLLCTQNNILNQVFKLVGNVYGWSDLWDSRDCSSLLRDTYKTFGIMLPRNASNQAQIFSHIDVSKMSIKEKKKFIMTTPVGSMIYMPGHAMMYIGSDCDEPYIIHACYKAGKKDRNNKVNMIVYNCVVVSKLSDLYKEDGKSFLENINSVSSLNINKDLYVDKR